MKDLICALQKHDPDEKIVVGTNGNHTYASFYPLGDGYKLNVLEGGYQNACYLEITTDWFADSV